MQRLRHLFFVSIIFLLCCTALTGSSGVGRAQGDGGALSAEEWADLGEVAPIVQELRPQRDKNVVLIFDVSGSMNSDAMLKRARQAAAKIVRYSVRPGDDVLLLTFGAGYDSFEKKIADGDDRQKVLDKIPVATGAGAGTNIRRPHHEALKFLERATAGNSHSATIIVLTDSFNDEPKRDNLAYEDYKRFYTPGGQLLKYPPTPENREYERLLRELVDSGRVKQYGIGIGFAPNGRPIERLPQSAPSPTDAPPTPPPVRDPAATKPAPPPFPYGWVLGGAGVVLLGLLALIPLFKTNALRITGGPDGAKDFVVGGGRTIRIGGEGASFSPDAYGIPGTKEAVAIIRGSRGLMTVAPPGGGNAGKNAGKNAAGAGSNQNGGVRVYVSGLPLEGDTPLNIGDELRIALPTENGGTQDFRLKFADPRKGY